MSNVQIPNLPAAIALSGEEQLEIVQAGSSARTTTAQVAALFSTAQGLRLPAFTTAERDALDAPPDGTLIYNVTTEKVQALAASVWVDLH